MITSRYNSEIGVLEVRYKGKLGYTELKGFGDSLMTNLSIPRELKILTDVRDGEYDLRENELQLVLNALQLQMSSFKFIKAAFIHTRPKETAISLISEERNTIPNYYHRVFSTRQAALTWLLENNV